MATGMKSTPNCVCGKNDWQDHGGFFGPGLQQRGMLCLACGGLSTFIANGGGNIFVIPNEKSGKIPDSAFDWVNNVVLPTWRARREKIEQAQKLLDDACWQKLNVPIGTEYSDIPKNQQEEWERIWDELHARPDYRIPVGFECPPIPARMPEGIICYVVNANGVWQQIKREETLALTQPPDPIRVKHFEFFNQVFIELAEIMGVEAIEREEIQNEYSGSEITPWFRFVIGENTIKLGHRKRVDAIKIEAPNGFVTKELRAVTVEEYGNTYWNDGDWQGKAELASEIEVHAWNKEQLMRLLTIVAQQSLKTE